MENRRPIPVKRKLMLAALAGGVGLSLAAIIVSFAVNALGSPQSTQQPTHTLPPDSAVAQQAPPLVDESAGQTHQSSLETSESPVVVQGIEPELQLVGILPVPRIVRLDNLGDSQRLAVQGYYSDGNVGELEAIDGMSVTYVSSNPSVAEVNPGGIITATRRGGVDIEVGYGDFTAQVPVFVWGTARVVPTFDSASLHQVADDGTALLVNRIILELKNGYGFEDAERLADTIGAEVIFEYRTFAGYLLESDSQTFQELVAALQILRRDGRVSEAYPDLVVPSSQRYSNPRIETLLLDRLFSEAYINAGMAHAWAIMNKMVDLEPVKIAVIDTGFLLPPVDPANPILDMTINHEFDFDRIWFESREDGVVAGGNIHGNSVASVIMAKNNLRPSSEQPESFSGVVSSVEGLEYVVGFYLVGEATGAESPGGQRIVENKTINNEEVTYALADIASTMNALEEISHFHGQFDVVNMSFGGKCYLGCSQGIYQRWRKLIESMPEITFVIAAGNDSVDANDAVPARFSLDLPNVITVGSVGPNGTLSEFSNYGDALTLAAPGEAVLVVGEYGYSNLKGTSFAAPLVTGTVGLMKALSPDYAPDRIKDVLIRTSNSIEGLCKNPTEGVKQCDPLPILDAGQTVRSLVLPRAEIRRVTPTRVELTRIPHETAWDDDNHEVANRFYLTVEIENTGLRTLGHEVEFTVTSPLGGTEAPTSKRININSGAVGTANLVLYGNIKKTGEWIVNKGQWKVAIKVRPSHELTQVLSERTITVDVVEGSQPTPIPTSTPIPPPTQVPVFKVEIDPSAAQFRRFGSDRVFEIPVKNIGSHRGKFKIKGKARSERSGNEFNVQYGPLVIDPGETRNLWPAMPRYELGVWILDIGVYSEFDPTTPLDSESITISVEQPPPPPTRVTPTPSPVPEPTPATQVEPPLLGDKEQLLTEFYNCMQRNLAFKTFIGGLTVLGDIGNPPPGSVLDDWDQFIVYYSNLFRKDPAAEEAIREFLPVFCP